MKFCQESPTWARQAVPRHLCSCLCSLLLDLTARRAMVVLNKNPLALDRKNLRELAVEQLYLSGRPYKPGMGLLDTVWSSLTAGKVKI